MADREATEHTIHVWCEFVKRALLLKSSCKTKTFDLRYTAFEIHTCFMKYRGKRIKHEYLFYREIHTCLMKYRGKRIKHEYLFYREIHTCLMKYRGNRIKHEYLFYREIHACLMKYRGNRIKHEYLFYTEKSTHV